MPAAARTAKLGGGHPYPPTPQCTPAHPNILGIWHNRGASPNTCGANLSEAGAWGRSWGKAGSAGVPLTPPPSLGTLGGPRCAPVPGRLSPGLPVGLCGMGGKLPPGQPGLLENRRGNTGEGLAWLRPGWGGSLQGFFHLLFLPGLHGLEAAPERG